MRIYEIISEGYSLESSVQSVASDIGAPVTQVYDALKESALRWLDGHDDLSKWPYIASSVVTRTWWDKIWDPVVSAKKGKASAGLQGHLWDLSRQSGPAGRELSALLKQMITARGNWGSLSSTLPPILDRIGRNVNSDLLVTRAKQWSKEHQEYQQFIDDLANDKIKDLPAKKGKGKAEHPDQVEISPVKKGPSLVAGQNVAVERLINDILSNLPSSVAGDIRQAIAKSGNKLSALQTEIAKRKISLR